MKTIKKIFGTHLGRLLVSALLTIVGGLIMQHTEDKHYIGASCMILGFGYLIIIGLIMITFGIRNSINDMKGGKDIK